MAKQSSRDEMGVDDGWTGCGRVWRGKSEGKDR